MIRKLPSGKYRLYSRKINPKIGKRRNLGTFPTRASAERHERAVSARFMRQDFFDFTPSFKLMISGNHKPGLRSVDEAIRRRFNLVPFTVTIDTSRRHDLVRQYLLALK
jgi:hypothetical protein